jgi:fluoride exporter
LAAELCEVTSYAFAAVGIGAALGAWVRWILGIVLNPIFPAVPLGTLAANVVGGYLVGGAVEYLSGHAGLSPQVRLFVITGFLGGLTTFSTYSAEAVTLVSRGQLSWFLVHLAGHLGGSLLMTVLGIYTVRALQG